VLKVNNLSCAVNRRNILNGINLDLHDSEILGITGAPCCGKSLLLAILSGSYGKYTGEIIIGDRELGTIPGSELKKAVSLCVPADRPSSPESTVFDTVISGRRTRKSIFNPYTDADRESAAKCMEQLGLAPHADDRIKNISGSVLRMSMIASSLMTGCGLLLLDSPESGLGYRQRADISAMLKKYTASAERTVIIASSDLGFLTACCDRIAVIENGRIAAEGTTRMIDEKFMKRFFDIEAMISWNVVTSLPEIHIIEF